ncbi:TIGR01244 family phosphatase [Qipengyuania sp. 1XM1-15A]|uniref:TIGR01244 family sulfur transferase n=1 Tax=Qipengyuania xiamenensis TaxID=2867237 RepID=UPI001C87833E|nr:TIGR01244 family sulfur transferase [Qipengyuania xiamenensis]MBX7533814.1 TIGR01244 family phosphatase [Qipengyuania xiamenensis]
MADFRKITDNLLASPQIEPADVAAAKAEGVTLIINNRPDGEAPDQPDSSAIESAAHEAGIDYVAIPVSGGGFSQPQVDAMAEALGNAEGKVLAFCRSGTRSTFLWALSQAKAGADPDEIASKAAAGGYDVSPIRQTLEMLSGSAGS